LTAGGAEASPHANPRLFPVMCLPPAPTVSDYRHLLASRALARQPLAVRLAGLAFIAGTWDNNNHSAAKVRPRVAPGQGTLLQVASFAPKY